MGKDTDNTLTSCVFNPFVITDEYGVKTIERLTAEEIGPQTKIKEDDESMNDIKDEIRQAVDESISRAFQKLYPLMLLVMRGDEKIADADRAELEAMLAKWENPESYTISVSISEVPYYKAMWEQLRCRIETEVHDQKSLAAVVTLMNRIEVEFMQKIIMEAMDNDDRKHQGRDG